MHESDQSGQFIGHPDHEPNLGISDSQPLDSGEIKEGVTGIPPPAVVISSSFSRFISAPIN